MVRLLNSWLAGEIEKTRGRVREYCDSLLLDYKEDFVFVKYTEHSI